MFKRYKAAKRVLALLLCGCLVFGSVNQARFKSYAIVTEIIAGGAAIAGGLAIGYLLHMLGVTAGSKEVYKSKETVIDWANEQVAKYKKWNAANKDAYKSDDLDKEFGAWTTKLKQGTLDKSSAIWKDFRSWVSSSVYKLSFPGYGPDNPFVGSYGSISSISRPYTFYDKVISVTGCKNYFVAVLKIDSSPKDRGIAVSDSPGTVFVDGEIKELEYNEVHLSKDGRNFDYPVYMASCFDPKFLNEKSWFVDSSMPNYLGRDRWGYGKACATTLYELVKAGAFSSSKDKSYGYTGGISDVYNKSNVLDNVDIVGGVDAPTAVGAVSVPIAWPVNEDTLVDTLGGVKDGSIPWDKTLSNVGTAAVDVAGGKTYVIGNEGVTTKEYVYAKDKADAKDEEITVPDVVAPSANLGAYTIAGLEKLFPFCLPFDLIDFIKVLDAPAEAPKFTIPFKYPTRSGTATYDIVIDLSIFNSVAELLRDMECLAFIVGLIMITRSRMIRG